MHKCFTGIARISDLYLVHVVSFYSSFSIKRSTHKLAFFSQKRPQDRIGFQDTWILNSTIIVNRYLCLSSVSTHMESMELH